LGIVAHTAEEVEYAQQVRTECSMLSLPDCFALSCAARPDHILVSGDLDLRNEAVARIGQLFEGLTKIYAHPRCRLPQPLIKARLKTRSEG
jgi:3',5'-cyclic AMP phosphodiesterase CpdA